MSTSNELLSVESTNLEYIEMLEALERLEKNKDYQKIIGTGYIKDEALRITGLLSNATIKQQGHRPDLIERLVGIASFQDYIEAIRALGNNAKYNKAHPLDEQDLVNSNMEDN